MMYDAHDREKIHLDKGVEYLDKDTENGGRGTENQGGVPDVITSA